MGRCQVLLLKEAYGTDIYKVRGSMTITTGIW